MKFYGKIEDGKPKIAENYKEFFDCLEEGEAFEIKVTRSKDIRNLKMNNLYWLWLGQLSLFSGYSKRELHNYFKQELLCHEVQIKGETILDCLSTSDLSIEEFSHYLDEVARLSSQNFSFILLEQS